jgi:hypothetical protein
MFHLWIEFCLVMKTPYPVDAFMGRGDTPGLDFGPILPYRGTACYKWYHSLNEVMIIYGVRDD